MKVLTAKQREQYQAERRWWRAAALAGLAACAGLRPPDPCSPLDPLLASSSFVVVTQPAPGARVASPLVVRGCSRTFESNLVWELRARDGRVLDAGHTTGGGVAGAAARWMARVE